MMVRRLKVLFGGILIGMLVVTTLASLDRGMFEAASALWPDLWFRATLADAYFGFVTVFAWIAYKEKTLLARVVWFLLVMGLGNIAVSLYILAQLRRLEPGDSIEKLLLRTE